MMMYESPIKIIEEIANQVNMELEGNILKAVRRVAIDVDEKELLKALQYDRDQYQKGYEDGQRDAVVHGRWIEETVDCGDPFDPYKESYADVLRCSECGEYSDATYQLNFCPNCGAKMDGKEE